MCFLCWFSFVRYWIFKIMFLSLQYNYKVMLTYFTVLNFLSFVVKRGSGFFEVYLKFNF